MRSKRVKLIFGAKTEEEGNQQKSSKEERREEAEAARNLRIHVTISERQKMKGSKRPLSGFKKYIYPEKGCFRRF